MKLRDLKLMLYEVKPESDDVYMNIPEESFEDLIREIRKDAEQLYIFKEEVDLKMDEHTFTAWNKERGSINVTLRRNKSNGV